jgi:FkbM family methyltransferase
MLSRVRSIIGRGVNVGLAPLNLTIRDISTVPTWDAFFNQIRNHHIEIRSIFDIGVDQGTPELYDAFPNAGLFLFDPTPAAAAYMKKLAAKRTVHSFNVALSDRRQENVALYSPVTAADGSGETTLLQKQIQRGTPLTTSVIVTERFDDLVGKVETPALCKIDVQGAELMVLQGMTKQLSDIDYFIIETSTLSPFKEAAEFDQICRFMMDHGFALYDVMALQRRPLDGALGAMDVAFVKKTCPLRADPRWGGS